VNPQADTLDADAITVARDMTWTLAIAAHSEGLATMWIEIDSESGELYYGLMWARVSEHTRTEGNDG
jgi:hypothetical protein